MARLRYRPFGPAGSAAELGIGLWWAASTLLDGDLRITWPFLAVGLGLALAGAYGLACAYRESNKRRRPVSSGDTGRRR